MKTKASNQNRFIRIITIPIRVLGKAKDLYVKSMSQVGDRVSYGNVMGMPAAGHLSTLPKSFSVSSSRSDDNEDYAELMRAVSKRNDSLGNIAANSRAADMDYYRRQEQIRRSSIVAGSSVVPRSCSVGMGRIDEDAPSDFGAESLNVKSELMYPRSRSYAVTKRGAAF
ncbi:hypothetical protein RJ639_016618 [Escallonia herrerae]|uniref:Uncharacterized protein n=1 Tax=Escallonia herrerae TaxID=1293975 RepID=A0AA88VF39_9ASTE|nr:hypothetical protein RJ639_016618 [Escallonia herrerae]